jgi:NADH:ubiquinone oxidoreductase subunit 4 (subunit M)
LYIRTGTRSIDMLSGLVVYFPTLSKVIWLFLFIFWGLPFTLKFFIELWVLLCFFNTGSFILLFMLLFILFFANVFVTKVWLQTIYGNPTKINLQGDLTSW